MTREEEAAPIFKSNTIIIFIRCLSLSLGYHHHLSMPKPEQVRVCKLGLFSVEWITIVYQLQWTIVGELSCGTFRFHAISQSKFSPWTYFDSLHDDVVVIALHTIVHYWTLVQVLVGLGLIEIETKIEKLCEFISFLRFECNATRSQ